MVLYELRYLANVEGENVRKNLKVKDLICGWKLRLGLQALFHFAV